MTEAADSLASVEQLAKLVGARVRIRRQAEGDCEAVFSCNFELQAEVIDDRRHPLDSRQLGGDRRCLDDAAAVIEGGDLDDLVELCIRARPTYVLGGGRLEIYRCDARQSTLLCRDCDGAGWLDCRRCRAAGTIACEVCGGASLVRGEPQPCVLCRADGAPDQPAGDCSACGGKGYLLAGVPVTADTREIPCPQAQCAAGQVSCPDCGGEGHQRCASCAASGLRQQTLRGTVVAKRSGLMAELRLPEEAGSASLALDPGQNWLLEGWKPGSDDVVSVSRSGCKLHRPLRWQRTDFQLELPGGGKALPHASALAVHAGERSRMHGSFFLDPVLSRWARLTSRDARLRAGQTALGRALIEYDASGLFDGLLDSLIKDEILSPDHIVPAAANLADAETGPVNHYWMATAALAPVLAVGSATFATFTWFGTIVANLFGIGVMAGYALLTHLAPLLIARFAGASWRQPSPGWVRQALAGSAGLALVFPGLIWLGFHL